MKKSTKQWFCIGGIATTIAAICYHYYKQNEPNRVLDKIKAELASMGKIKSSWLDDTPHTYKNGHHSYIGYRGGITIVQNNQEHYYEFIVKKHHHQLMELTEKKLPI